jgi:hypothetical protein
MNDASGPSAVAPQTRHNVEAVFYETLLTGPPASRPRVLDPAAVAVLEHEGVADTFDGVLTHGVVGKRDPQPAVLRRLPPAPIAARSAASRALAADPSPRSSAAAAAARPSVAFAPAA